METPAVPASPEDCARLVLPAYAIALRRDDFWETGLATEVREAGRLWARTGGRLDDLLNVLNAMASLLLDAVLRRRRTPDTRCATLRRFSEVSGRVAIELASGFGCGTWEQVDAAVTRSGGTRVAAAAAEPVVCAGPTAVVEPVVDTAVSVVVAFRIDGGRAETVAPVLHRLLRGGTVVVDGDRGHALLRSRTEAEAVTDCEAVVAGLHESRTWAVVLPADGSHARERASELLGIVTALDMPPGVYRRGDLLVECAAMRSPVSAGVLRRLIAPVLAVDVLRATLAALIAEDGNRTCAAERLFIHRSTIDYRLSRIEQLTGHCPRTVRGLSVLTAAYALCTAAG